MRFRIISDSDIFTLVFLPIFYCMNVSVLLIQPPGCHNPINVMLMLCYCCTVQNLCRTKTDAILMTSHRWQ